MVNVQRRMRKLLVASFIIGVAIGALGAAVAFKLLSGTQNTIVVFARSSKRPSPGGRHTTLRIQIQHQGGATIRRFRQHPVSDEDLTDWRHIPSGLTDYLLLAAKQGVVNLTTGHVKVFAYLVPAIIVQKGNPKNITSLEDLARPGVRVGIGDPESVCIGLYAKELLEKNALWASVSKNIIVYAQSCDATAALIPAKAVDAIIGWHVFQAWTPDKANIVWITSSRIPKISYIAGALSTFADNTASAEAFLDFLASTDAQAIWAKYGYFATLEDAKVHAPNATIELLATDQ